MAKSGRPLSIADAKAFKALADAYFAARDADGKPITLCGLCLALGISGRASLLNYEKRPEYSEVVKRAKLRIEAEYEARLHGPNATGAIFGLKNFGWTDKQELEHTGELVIKWQDKPEKS